MEFFDLFHQRIKEMFLGFSNHEDFGVVFDFPFPVIDGTYIPDYIHTSGEPRLNKPPDIFTASSSFGAVIKTMSSAILMDLFTQFHIILYIKQSPFDIDPS